MLPASVNFEIEFEAVAFIERRQARPFHRTDVNERIRLAIVTGNKPEPFGAVEELYCPGRLFTRKFALRRGRTRICRDHVTNNLQISCGNLSAPVYQVELKFLTLGQSFQACALHRTDVDEDVSASAFLLDETKALLRVEEFHHALAGADDLCRHAARRTAATATGATRPTTKAATTSAAAAAAAKAIVIETSRSPETVTTAKVIPTPCKGIETFLAESVTLVATTTAAPSVKTHKAERTFESPTHSTRQRGRIAPDIQRNDRKIAVSAVNLGDSIAQNTPAGEYFPIPLNLLIPSAFSE